MKLYCHQCKCLVGEINEEAFHLVHHYNIRCAKCHEEYDKELVKEKKNDQ